ncbi:DUF503 family protein [Listeria monocytogenes]|uniref:DUF503 family protein n=1 Tax=Listeria monocytogenes TaxID=1639 RepID=UPI000D73F9F3|nr:DUF503 family protein [Listeria monocytogenes]PXD76346.1 DUF503 domain-containing protein [Listeria monocytogenes]
MIQSVVSEFFMQEPQNLKEKRAILKRIITRAKQKFNISIASSHIQAEKEAREVLAFLDSFPEWERAETVMEKL